MLLDMEAPKNGIAVIGDVHGCWQELGELLAKIGDKTPIFVGDFFDRGPDNDKVADYVLEHKPLSVRGNHCQMLIDYVNGSRPYATDGMEATINQLSPEKLKEVVGYLDTLPYCIKVSGAEKKLYITHGSVTPLSLVRSSFSTQDQFAMLWSRHNHSRAWSVLSHIDYCFGHTPTEGAIVTVDGNYINVDAGCVYGGRLGAFLWPERKTVLVESKSEKTYMFGKKKPTSL
jgi:protein phosphatase